MSNTVAPLKSMQLHWLMPTVDLGPGLSLENVVRDSVSGTALLEAESSTLLFFLCSMQDIQLLPNVNF